ncbi:hypothetical protein V6N13_014211 [Hibiscus sabdariffa]|uniref:Leucine-rich repeat-containing N-terminal plant-type domain-containing protein n=1 Tax=Hibiscus sabdariffa TaxID=183260 RepID=A0ABR2RV90_9ROSI
MRFLLLLPFVLLHISHTSAATVISELRALLTVKSSITDDPQSYLSNWNATTPICSFTGVTCDYTGRHVTSIDLTNFYLSGTLSPSFAHGTSRPLQSPLSQPFQQCFQRFASRSFPISDTCIWEGIISLVRSRQVMAVGSISNIWPFRATNSAGKCPLKSAT